MGNDPDARYFDGEQWVAILNNGVQRFEEPFWIDLYEVTNAQFQAFSGKADEVSSWDDPNRPRNEISWSEANDFCKQRGARLPTEAEWEYAARGPDNWIYPWGNESIEGNAVYNTDQPSEVGSKPDGISWVGAHDMSGNVWEWTATFDGDILDNIRILKGGAWNDPTSNRLRTANRLRSGPDNRGNNMGFRCVRDDAVG